jgi:hypothetical protein
VTIWLGDRGFATMLGAGSDTTMSFCDHCEGQRFDRARVLRSLRDAQRRLRHSAKSKSAEEAIARAIEMIRRLEIPHLEVDDDDMTGASIH